MKKSRVGGGGKMGNALVVDEGGNVRESWKKTAEAGKS